MLQNDVVQTECTQWGSLIWTDLDQEQFLLLPLTSKMTSKMTKIGAHGAR